jgi:hypothetical protein
MQPTVIPKKSIRFLVSNDFADSFLTMSATESGAQALAGGEATKALQDAASSAALSNAAAALLAGTQVIERLARDATRSLPERHDAARKVANNVMDKFHHAKSVLEQRSKQLAQSAHDEADEEFAPKFGRMSLESEIRAYVREQAAKPEGIGKVRSLLSVDRDVANVVYHSPHFLLGINENLHQEYRLTVMQKFAPDAYLKLAESTELKRIAPNLETTAKGVKASFYSPGEAAQVSTRVEV